LVMDLCFYVGDQRKLKVKLPSLETASEIP
jgi:hypothetical protein